MIVDIYPAHIYPPKSLDMRVRDRLKLRGLDPDDPVGSLIKNMDKAGVDVTAVGTGMGPYIPDEIKKYPNRLFGISGVRFVNGKPDIEKVEHDVTSLGWKALNLSPTSARAGFYPNDFEKMGSLYEKAIDLDVVTAWHPGGHLLGPHRTIFGGPRFLTEVAFKYPQLKILISHLGETQPPGQEQEYIELASTYPNVYIEASALIPFLMWRAMPPKNPIGPPEMDSSLVISRNWAFMNSDYIEKAKTWYYSEDPKMMEAWRKVKEKHRTTIRSCALQCPNKFMFALDFPFAMRYDIALELYREALADDEEILNKVLGENARKLFKL